MILGNLSALRGDTVRRWASKNRVELCLTPAYASWANPIEAYFGPLRQFTVANSNHRNHTAQTRALHAYLRRRNANARHPDVLAAQRKERARTQADPSSHKPAMSRMSMVVSRSGVGPGCRHATGRL